MRTLKKISNSRKPKNKFIHNPENDWSRCFVTKAEDSTTYVSKSKLGRETTVKVTSYLQNSLTGVVSTIPVYLNQKIIELIPRQLNSLFLAIEKSKYILLLEDNWDGEGALKYDSEVWKKAILYLSKLATKIYKRYGNIIPTPKIYHGPNGSIDIYWENNVFNLLLNFPPTGPGSFYGDDYSSNKSEGFFDQTMIKDNVFPFLVDLE